MTKVLIYLLTLVSLLNGAMMKEIPGKVITIEQLDEMFYGIKQNGQWDLSEPLLWGYFFTDSDPYKLESVVPTLQEMGYKFVGIFQADKESEDEPDLFFLHVELVEIHNSTSLDKRNDELYIFAHQKGLDSYDGMDVGPVIK
jgi:hypothetical protein